MRRNYVLLIFFIVLVACKKSNVISNNTAPNQGYLVNSSFDDSSFSQTWSIHDVDTKVIFGQGILVTEGDSGYNDYMEYTSYTPFENNSYSVSFLVRSKTSSSFGIGFTTAKNIFLNSSSIQGGLDLTTNSDSGKLFLGYNIAPKITQSSAALPFNIGDSLGLLLYCEGWNIFLIANNYTQHETVTCNIYNPTLLGTGGKFRIVFLGGSQTIKNASIYSSIKASGGTVIVGNSISAGSGATVQQNRYADRLFNSNSTLYDNSSHPSVMTIDVVKYLPGILSAKAKYAIVSLGENDRNQRLDTTIFKTYYDSIVNALLNNGTRPVLISLCPSGIAGLEVLSHWYNNIIMDIAAKYQLDYVDIDTPLCAGGDVLAKKYNFDDVHPNDAGHSVIANTILRKAPYLLHPN